MERLCCSVCLRTRSPVCVCGNAELTQGGRPVWCDGRVWQRRCGLKALAQGLSGRALAQQQLRLVAHYQAQGLSQHESLVEASAQQKQQVVSHYQAQGLSQESELGG